MTTFILTPKTATKGLGCLNMIACPNCGAPTVDTLDDKLKDRKYKAFYCPMCEHTGHYQRFTKTVKY